MASNDEDQAFTPEAGHHEISRQPHFEYASDSLSGIANDIPAACAKRECEGGQYSYAADMPHETDLSVDTAYLGPDDALRHSIIGVLLNGTRNPSQVAKVQNALA
jgi:hypothetical protein